jgi:MFS family permease
MRIIAVGSLVGGASVAALATGQGLLAFLALIAIQGLVISIVDIVALTQLQRAVGPAALGRAIGAVDSMTSVAMVGGTILAPWLAATAGLDAALATGGIALAGIGAVAAVATRGEPAVDAPVEARVRLLGGLALFADAPRFAVEGLAGASRELRVGAGTAVVTEGEPADALYVVVSGTLDVTQGPVGARLTELRDGDFFGEIGLVKGVPRTATVTARSATTLLRIEAETFRGLIESGAAHHAVLGRSVGLRLARRVPASDAVASRR